MLILGIDTATKTGSVSLYDDEKGVISELNLNIKKNHSNTLMKAVDTVLKFSEYKIDDLDKIAVSIGPGSFTGIRVGVGAAKGFCYGKNIDIVGVNELDILANSIPFTEMKILSLIDARKERVYYAEYIYENREIKKNSEYKDGDISEILQKYLNKKIMFTGDGSIVYEKIIKKILSNNAYFQKKSGRQAKASILCEMAIKQKGMNIYTLEPFYLSKTQAERMKEKTKK